MWFRSLFELIIPQRSRLPVQKARHSSQGRLPAYRRLAVEVLEDRFLPTAMLAIGDVAIMEGNAGPHNAQVLVTVSEAHANSITVNYGTAPSTAQVGSDYGAVSGKLTFARGELSKSIQIPLIGDRVPEADETFSRAFHNRCNFTSPGHPAAAAW